MSSEPEVDELDLDIVVNDPFPCPNGVLCLDRGSFLLSTLPIESTNQQALWKHQVAFNKTNRIAMILPETSEVGVFRLKDIERSCQQVENVLLDKAKTPADRREAIRELEPLRKLKLGGASSTPSQVHMNQLGEIAVLTAAKQLVWFSAKDTKPSHTVQQVVMVQLSSQGSWVAYCTDLDTVLLCSTDFSSPIALEIGDRVTALCFCDDNESLLCVATSNGRVVLFEDGNELVSFTLEEDVAISTVLWPEDQLLAYATQERFKIIELAEDLGAITLGRFATDPLLHSEQKCKLDWFIEFNSQWRCFFLANTWSDSVCVVGFDDYGEDQGTDWVQWNLKRGMESGFPQVSVLEQNLHHVSDRLPSTEDGRVSPRVLGMLAFSGSVAVSPFFVLKNNEEIEGKQDYAAPIPSVLLLNSEGICQLVGFVDCTPMEERQEEDYVLVSDEEEEEFVEVEDPPLFQEKSTTPEPLGGGALTKKKNEEQTPFSFTPKVPPPATPFSFTPKVDVAATPFSFSSKPEAAAAPFSFSSKPEAAAAPFSFSSKPEAPAAPFSFSSKPEAPAVGATSKPTAAAAPPATPFDVTSKPAASAAPFSSTSKPAAKPAPVDVDELTRQMEEMQVKLKNYEQEIARLKGATAAPQPKNELSAKALQEPTRMNFTAPQSSVKPSTAANTRAVKPQPNLASVYKELSNSFALRDKELQQCFNFDLDPFPPCCFDAEKYAEYTKFLFTKTEETSQLIQDTLQMSAQIGFTIDAANQRLRGGETAAIGVDDKLLQDLIRKKHVLQHQLRRLRRELDLCTKRKAQEQHATWTLQDDRQRATSRLARMSDLVHKLERRRYHVGDVAAVPPNVESNATTVVKSVARRFAPVSEISSLSPVVDVHMSVGEKLRETASAVTQVVNEWQLHISEVEKLQLKHKQITRAAVPPLPPKPLAVKPKSAVKALDSAAFAKPPAAPEIKAPPAPTPAPPKEEEKPAPPPLAPIPAPQQPAVAAATPMDLKTELGAFYTEIGQAKDDATLNKLAQQYGAQTQVLLAKLQEKYKDSFASKPQLKSAYDKLAEKINRTAAPASPASAFSFAQPAAPPAAVSAFQTTPNNNNPFQPAAAPTGNNPFMAAPSSAFTSSPVAPQQQQPFGSFQQASPAAQATAPPNTQQALTQFYQQYNPQKVGDVPTLLQKFQGKETEMWISLKKKYPHSAQFVDQVLNATIGNSGMGGIQQQSAFSGGGFASFASAAPSSGFGGFAAAPSTPSSGGFGNAFGGGFPQQQNAFNSSGFGTAGPAGGFGAVASTPPAGGGFGNAFAPSSGGSSGGFGAFSQGGASAFGGGAFSTPAPVNKNLSNAFSQMRG